MDALILARMQFAANISFHILFPTISIGLGWLLLFFRLRWLKTRHAPDPDAARGWLDAYRFWTKVFALSFALGVVSGLTMSVQLGTNWPGFMERVGNVAGPLDALYRRCVRSHAGMLASFRIADRGARQTPPAIRPAPASRKRQSGLV